MPDLPDKLASAKAPLTPEELAAIRERLALPAAQWDARKTRDDAEALLRHINALEAGAESEQPTKRKEKPWSTNQKTRIEDKTVYVTVSGLTGVGKSVVYTEIATALAAIGLKVEHTDPSDAKMEARLNGYDQLLMYEPRILMDERNIPRPPSPPKDTQ